MTHRQDVAGGHDVVARWCALAEQRLQHLTEMFESGRWRRYYSENAFIENVKEAKVAVDTWRSLSAPASIEGVSAVALSSLSHPIETSPRRSTEPEFLSREPRAPEPIEIRAAPAELASSDEVPPEPIADMIALDRAIGIAEASFDMSAIEQRYPLLRNSLKLA